MVSGNGLSSLYRLFDCSNVSYHWLYMNFKYVVRLLYYETNYSSH